MFNRARRFDLRTGLLPLLLFLLVGCSTSKPLMPSPVVYHDGRVDYASAVDEDLRTTTVEVFYATNRGATGTVDDRSYNNDMVDQLHLGMATG